MFVGDEQRDPGAAWILLAYHQYMLLETSSVLLSNGRNILVTNL